MLSYHLFSRIPIFLIAVMFVQFKSYAGVNEDLIIAVKNNDYAQVEKAIKAGADVNAIYDDYGWTALDYAAYYGNLEIVKLLLKENADVNGRIDKPSRTPLMIATENGKKEVVEYFINAGADVNLKNRSGQTALMIAVCYAKEMKGEIVELLINAKANVNAKDNDGETALMIAARNVKKENVELLIKAKADVKAKNNDGKTALNVTGEEEDYFDDLIRVRTMDEIEINHLLISAGAKE